MVICFDLDGTILDTFELIRATFIEVFERFYPQFKPTEEDLKTYFGPTLVETFTKVGCNEEEVKMMYDNYKIINARLQPSLIKPYPKVEELLIRLKQKGYKLTIFSNKTNNVIKSGLNEVGLLSYFDFILGYNEVARPKPDRCGIDKIKELFNDDVIYVGDSPSDILTAKNADILGIGVSQAVIDSDTLYQAGADYVIDKISELDKLLEEINV